MSNSNNDLYKTSDTALATYLCCKEYKLEKIDYSGVRYEFQFSRQHPKDNGDIQSEADRYLVGTALVNPATYQKMNRKLMRIIKLKRQWWED